jgi:hypothetical protein
MYVETTKVWVTDPARHPNRIEYHPFELDRPVLGPVRDLPHIAYRWRLDAEMSDAGSAGTVSSAVRRDGLGLRKRMGANDGVEATTGALMQFIQRAFVRK